MRETPDPDIITNILEPLVDRYGLTHVVAGLSLLCAEKAAHIRQNWQDKGWARAWDYDSNMLEDAARRVRSDG